MLCAAPAVERGATQGAARERARKAGVEVRFLAGSIAALRDADVGSGFRLVLDFGAMHGLAPAEVKTVAREVTAVTTDDATRLMYAFSPGREGPTPRGLSRDEVEAAYVGWTLVDEQPFDGPGAARTLQQDQPALVSAPSRPTHGGSEPRYPARLGRSAAGHPLRRHLRGNRVPDG